MIMTIHNQAHTRQTAVHLIIQVAVMEAAVIHQKAILPENTIVVVHQEAVQILQAAATVQRNIIMIHTMMVMMIYTWMTIMIMTGIIKTAIMLTA